MTYLSEQSVLVNKIMHEINYAISMFFFFYLDVLKIVVLDFHALPNFTSFTYPNFILFFAIIYSEIIDIYLHKINGAV